MVNPLAVCGTSSGIARHRQLREPPCEACKQERNRQERERTQKHGQLARRRRQNSEAATLPDLQPTMPIGAEDWRAVVYTARSLNTELERKQPRVSDQRRILAVQGNVCLYCGVPIGTIIGREMKRKTGYIFHTTVTLQRNWDHFVPFSYLIQNPGANWVLACHVCNRVKGSRVFATVEEARRLILPGRQERGYESPRRVLARLATGGTSMPAQGAQRGAEGDGADGGGRG